MTGALRAGMHQATAVTVCAQEKPGTPDLTIHPLKGGVYWSDH
jgi:hypothetical protein